MSSTRHSDAATGLTPGSLTLRETADALGTSTTTLRKLIRQGRLPEAEKVKTADGRVWSIPSESIPGIASRAGFSVDITESIDLRDPEQLDADVETDVIVDLDDDTSSGEAIDLESWRREPVPSEIVVMDLGDQPTVVPLGLRDQAGVAEVTVAEVANAPLPTHEGAEPDVIGTKSIAPEAISTAIEAIGSEAEVEVDSDGPLRINLAPTLAEVLDTALLEKLLGAQEQKTVALVKAERQATEYEALAARQLDVERQFSAADAQRIELAERLHNEALARAIADARVTELRDQLQREITYAEAERYERRQALAREAKAAGEAAEVRAHLGWWARRKLNRDV